MNSRDYEIFQKFDSKKATVTELALEYKLTEVTVRQILNKGYKSF